MKKQYAFLSLALISLLLLSGCLNDPKTEEEEMKTVAYIQVNNFSSGTIYFWTLANGVKREVGPNTQASRKDFEYLLKPGIVMPETIYVKKANSANEYDAKLDYNISYQVSDTKVTNKEIIFTWNGTTLNYN